MKSLVTGGVGFIGSHLVKKLLDIGHEVTVVDNYSAESDARVKYFGAVYEFGSVTDPSISKLFKGVDYVFHLAAESRIPSSIDNPELAMETNVLGTYRVLQHSLDNNVKRVMYSSTSAAYGLNNPIPLEEDMKTDCLNPYSITKVAGEDFCRMFTTMYGLQTVIFRYFNVYGEGQPTKGQYAPVIGLFKRQSESGKAMTIVGDGEQTRDYIHVSDVVEANIAAMFADDRVSGEILNVGTGKRHTVNDIARMIGGDYTFVSPRLGEARHTQANISKTICMLNWNPKTKLEEWIKNDL